VKDSPDLGVTGQQPAQPAPRPEPDRAENSPGRGLPSTTPEQDETLSRMPGEWMLEAGRGMSSPLTITGTPGIAAGAVTTNGQWSYATEAPVRWIYLAPGSLTLTDSGGNIVWRGRETSDGFTGSMEGGAPAAELIRR
jgi:hypothetical protein